MQLLQVAHEITEIIVNSFAARGTYFIKRPNEEINSH